jgi:methionyl-tRNA formyltransferase
VHVRADALGLAVRTPVSLRTPEDQAAFASLGLDAAVVAAYGLILPQPILSAPRLGCFNIHASILPRWRGAAPVQRAILAGDRETGITIMQMEKGLDTGPMLAVDRCPVGEATAGELTATLAALGAARMAEVLADLSAYPPVRQDDAQATYAHKIEKAEARIDWTLYADAILRLVRAMQPAPGAWFEDRGTRVKLLEAKPGDGSGNPGDALPGGRIAAGLGAILPIRVQPEGKPAMPAQDWWNGRRSTAPLT